MNIRTVSYRRTKQIKPYEPEVIELTIDLEKGDTVDNVVAASRIIVAKQFGETNQIKAADPDGWAEWFTKSGCTCDKLLAQDCQCGGK